MQEWCFLLCFLQSRLKIMRKFVYSIQGNIGSGKSTLLQLLGKYIPQVVLSPEPIGQWQKIGRFNILQAYYKEPHRWAYTFQNYALLTRTNQLYNMLRLPCKEEQFLFSERSVVADKEIFAKLQLKEGKMNEMEFEMYLKLFDDLNKLAGLHPIHRHIYLRTDPKKCLQRMQKRGRKEESTVSLEYLNDIHELHEEWLGKGFIIEGNPEFQTDQTEVRKMAGKIKEWITKNH